MVDDSVTSPVSASVTTKCGSVDWAAGTGAGFRQGYKEFNLCSFVTSGSTIGWPLTIER
jgi:hypothetical protein